jgi:hypothetical protein
MIHYHGTPITPQEIAVAVLRGRHALISFAYPVQICAVSEVCSSFVLDNGAFSFWKNKKPVNWPAYYSFVRDWRFHPRFDWALIPDVIDGTEEENDALIEEWPFPIPVGVPVWHLNESFERLLRLAKAFPRVALGSSGQFAKLKTEAWWGRMHMAMWHLCGPSGIPPVKLHGLRMLDRMIVEAFPFSTGDSGNIALNVGPDKRWKGTYAPMTKMARAFQIADRMETYQSAEKWEI